jgi:phospholipid-binding lipoprotein MlaA
VVDQGALDPYAFIRDAFLQRRESLVHDGNPPEEGDLNP